MLTSLRIYHVSAALSAAERSAHEFTPTASEWDSTRRWPARSRRGQEGQGLVDDDGYLPTAPTGFLL